MRVVVYGINYSPELTGIGKYTGEFVEWLIAQGHECKVITAPPYYPDWQVGRGYNSWKYKIEISPSLIVYRCPLYVPKKPTTITRILHLLSFVASSSLRLFSLFRWKPDVIICIAPSFKCAPSALLAGKLFGAKTVLHVQDFEIDAMFGLGMAGRSEGKLARAVYRLESWVMKRFDRVSTISQSMRARLIDKGVSDASAMLFPNWVDVDVVTPNGNGERYRKQWGFHDDDILILYSGNIGKKQGLSLVLDAAKKLKTEERLRFIFVGEGAERQALEQQAHDLNLCNVSFYPLQPMEDLPDLLCFADIHLVIQRKGAADAVMPSKVTGILSAGGQAIVTAESHTELGLVLTQNPDIASLIEPEDVSALVAEILLLADKVNTPKRGYNMAARRYAEENLGKHEILRRFEMALHELTSATN